MPPTFHVTQTLREGGLRSWAKALERFEGEERTFERSRAYRIEHPSGAERAMIDRLAELGLWERVDYAREYPLVYDEPDGGRAFIMPDMAWPERRLAIEVHGSIRQSRRFGADALANDARKAVIYDREGWRVLAVTERELHDDPAGVRARARAFLAGSDGPGRAEEG